MRAQVARRPLAVAVTVALESTSRWVSFARAAFLLVAYFATRTEWVSEGGRPGNKLFVLPDPNAWYALVTPAGIIALADLAVGV